MKTVSLPDRIATAALALMLVLPFANPIHTAPIPSFYSEWLAAALALAVIAATLAATILRKTSLAVPSIAALPLLLAATTLAHALAGHAAHPRQAMLVAAYMLLAAAMMIAGRSMATSMPFEQRAPLLARYLMAGSLLQCLVLALQTTGIGVPWLVFLPAPGAAATGSLGQANHLADYLWLGIVSAIYLMARRGRVSLAGCVPVLVIAVSSTFPASRSVMLYPLALALLALLAWHTGRAALWRHVTLIVIGMLPLMLAVNSMSPAAGSAAKTASTPSLSERLAATGSDGIRTSLYQVAFEKALERPLVGHGVGAAPWATFQRADTWPRNTRPAIAENIHNVGLQWLLEYGVPLAALALALVLGWLLRVLPGVGDASRWWGLALLAVIAIHSQLEYPLWFTYFLLPASWLMGSMSPATWNLKMPRERLWVAAAALLLGVATVAGLGRDYREIERIEAAGNDPRQWPQALAAAVELDRNSLLAPGALLFLVGAMAPDGDDKAARLELCSQALRVSPRPEIVAKCGLVERLAGNQAESDRLGRLAAALSRP